MLYENLSKHFLKVIALITSMVFWFYVISSEPIKINRKIQLAFIVPKGLAIGNVVSREVNITLKGARAFLANLFVNDKKVFIDLKSYSYKKEKAFLVFINPSDIPVPLGVKVTNIEPRKVELILEKKIYKKVPINKTLAGAVAKDLELTKSYLKPKFVMIGGPRELMRTISKLSTAPIDTSGLKGEGSLTAQLADLDDRIQKKKQQTIEYHYQVKPKKANLTLKKIRIRFLTSSQKIFSKSKFVSLSVLDTKGQNRALKNSDVQVIADIPENIKGKARIKLKAVLPEGIHLLKIHPDYIDIRVR